VKSATGAYAVHVAGLFHWDGSMNRPRCVNPRLKTRSGHDQARTLFLWSPGLNAVHTVVLIGRYGERPVTFPRRLGCGWFDGGAGAGEKNENYLLVVLIGSFLDRPIRFTSSGQSSQVQNFPNSCTASRLKGLIRLKLQGHPPRHNNPALTTKQQPAGTEGEGARDLRPTPLFFGRSTLQAISGVSCQSAGGCRFSCIRPPGALHGNLPL